LVVAVVSTAEMITLVVGGVGLVALAVFIWRLESGYDRRQPPHG
jgi:hypothetical protein